MDRIGWSAWIVALIALTGSLASTASASHDDHEPRWTQLGSGAAPTGSSAAVLEHDAARDEMILFGGTSESHVGTWALRDDGWHDLNPEHEPSDRHGAAAAYDTRREQLVMFGGYPTQLPSAETWIWDGTDWTLVEPSTSPPARSYASMAYDEARGEVVLFGGIACGPNFECEHLGDTWVWDGETWSERTTPSAPTAREGAAMTFDVKRGEIVLFGGSGDGTPRECVKVTNVCVVQTAPGESGVRDDTWTWDGETWTQEVTEVAPDPRNAMGAAYDPITEKVLIYGGVNTGGAFNDTWAWDGSAWSELAPLDAPERRFSPAMASDDDGVVLYGGHRTTYYADDAWNWDGHTWKQVGAPSPKRRYAPAMVYDPLRKSVVLFGGDADARFGDTWTYRDGWELQAPATSPSPRAASGFAFDAGDGRAVLFGGFDGSGADLNETWTWDGTTWEFHPSDELIPLFVPESRRGPAMAYDAARDEVVLFGGENVDGGTTFNDTWTWDGSAWTEQQPADAPPPLVDARMGYDPKLEQIVLFGGIDDQNTLKNETWIWDGGNWTQATPQDPPTPRAAVNMTYDAMRERVVMFAGLQSGINAAADVWEWDGSNWNELSFPQAPRVRFSAGFTYVPELAGSLLFGGNGGRYLNDTWLLRTTTVPRFDVPGVTLDIEDNTIVHGEAVTLSGSLTPDRCGSSPLRLERRVRSSDEWRAVATVSQPTDWTLAQTARASADYRARSTGDEHCGSAVSDHESVSVRAAISLERARCRDDGVTGRLRPRAPGSRVRLERRGQNGWSLVDLDRVDPVGRFELTPGKCASRHRVYWRSQLETHDGAGIRFNF